MLDALVATYPRALSRDELAGAAEITPTGGAFGTYLSKLKSDGLVDVEGGEIRAAGVLFGG